MKPYCSHIKHRKYECCKTCDGLDTDCENYHCLRQEKPIFRTTTSSPAERHILRIDYRIIRMYNDRGVI